MECAKRRELEAKPFIHMAPDSAGALDKFGELLGWSKMEVDQFLDHGKVPARDVERLSR